MAASAQYDIFLSHSGRQKGFVRDLHDRLSSMAYSVFFDQDPRSLPLGQPFPDHIFNAAQTCKLAVVVLSDDFLTTRWPMTELCAFADRLPSGDAFTLLPLFFQLSPKDLETKEKLQQWRETWEILEVQDSRGRISVAKCEEAVAKLLLTPTIGRIVQNLESEQGEASYIDFVAQRISCVLPAHKPNSIVPTPRKHYSGIERLCNIILEKFRRLELQPHPSESDLNRHACIVGMYGVPGSGKSTISRFLCESMHDEFRGNVDHFELPTKLDHHRISEDYLNFSQHCAELLFRFTSRKVVESMDPNKVLNLLCQAISSKKLFLVLDNITQSNYGSYKQIVKAILDSTILGVGSRILLVAESRAILESLVRGRSKLMYRYAITEVPFLTESEAMEIIRNGYPSVDEDRMIRLIRMHMSNFVLSSSTTYIPFVFEQIGVLLKANGSRDVDEVYSKLENLWKTVLDSKRVQKLVAMTFKCLPKELRVLFLDIARFIIPNGRSELSVAIPILSSMHDTVNPLIMRKKIDDLCKHCSLSIIEEKLQIHNIFIEYADSIVGNSITYVNKPVQILDTAAAAAGTSNSCDPAWVHLNCSEARTIAICAFLEWPFRFENPADDDRDHGILLQVEVGAKAKALIVRNRTSKCFIGLSGDLSSLVCLEMENVQQVAILPSATGAYPSHLLRLELTRKQSYTKDRLRNSLDLVSHEIQNEHQSPWTTWRSTPLFQGSLVASYMELVTSLASSGRMIGLRELIVANAGVSKLEDIGRHCPHLEDLEISDEDQELMFVSILSAPKLKRLITGQSFDYKRSNPYWQGVNHKGEYWPTKSSKLILNLPGCPELRQAWVDVCLFEQLEVMGPLPSGLRHFGLANHRSFEVMPTTWISPTAALAGLKTMELFRSKVEMLNFTMDSLGVLPGLRALCIHSCKGLKHLSVHPSCLPNLKSLHVADCRKLEVFEGLENLVKDHLQWFILRKLPHLQCVLSFGSVQVERIVVIECPGVKIHHSLLEYSKGLKNILFKETSIVTVQQDFGIENVIMSMGKYIEDIYIQSVTVHRMHKDGVQNSEQHTTINTPVAIDGSTNIKIMHEKEENEEDDDEISVLAYADHHAKKVFNIQSKTLHGSPAGLSSLCLPVLQVLLWFYSSIIVRMFASIADFPPDVSPPRSSSVCEPALRIHLTFLEGQYPFLEALSLSGLENIEEIEGVQHLHILRNLHLSNLPSLRRVSGSWPPSIQSIACFECPKLEEVPCLENAPELNGLVCHNCVKLRAVEFRCRQMLKRVSMSGDLVITLVGCESMEVFPMQEIIEELGKTREEYKYPWRNRRILVRVSGSKFATLEVMQLWLQEARLGSSLVDAALHGLVWECVKKDASDAEETLYKYFSYMYEFTYYNSHALEYVLQYFQDVLFPTDFTKSLFFPHFEEHEVAFFKQWIFQKFSLTQMEDHSKNRPKPDRFDYLTYLCLITQ